MTAPVYLVIVNYNGWQDTIECLESVLRSDYPDVRAIVVDNASANESMARLLDWARGGSAAGGPSPALRHLSTPPVPKPVEHVVFQADGNAPPARLPRITFIASERNLGFAGGNNLALRVLVDGGFAGYAGLINNDMVAAPDAVSRLVKTLDADERLAAVGGLILDYQQPDLVQSVGGGTLSLKTGMAFMAGAGLRAGEITEPGELRFISGGWLLMRIERLRDVGLMDESYFLYAEDADWGERMRRAGYRLGCAIDALAWHKGSQTTGAGSPFQDYYMVRSSLMFVRKHAPRNIAFAAAYLFYRTFLPKLARRQWARARAVLRAYGDYARGKR